jgi:TatA/E family protein of Tat protein translocase
MPNLGMTEILIILVIALIVFGPRKLPELGKSLGKAMGQFRRASEDFKRTWEQEVDLEKTRTAIATTSTTGSSHYSSNTDANHYDGSYDPYNSDYGYNAPNDTDVAAAETGEGSTTTTEPEGATAEVSTASSGATNKPQPGQWI